MASSAQAKQFILTIAPIIQEEAKKRGYKVCSPIIAQACVESAFGTSSLGYRFHNYFGMKCGSAWKGKSVNMATKEEYTPGTLTSIRDNFRAYDSIEEGVKGYFDFISTKRYENLKSAVTAEMYLALIKSDGYATSSKYVNTCMNCIKKYDLQKWDDYTNAPVAPVTHSDTMTIDKIDKVAREVIQGKWGNNPRRAQLLRVAGYNPSIVQARVNEILKGK